MRAVSLSDLSFLIYLSCGWIIMANNLTQEFVEHVRTLTNQTHAGYALVGASAIDNSLEEALLTRMVPLSSTLAERLFEGYGPLASFSSRIDIAFALGIISAETRSHLLTIKQIRNEFAHTYVSLTFGSPSIRKWCATLPGYRREATDAEALDLYLEVLENIIEDLKKLTAASEQPSSHEKSQTIPQPPSLSHDESRKGG
jgi:hypothetical protein